MSIGGADQYEICKFMKTITVFTSFNKLHSDSLFNY